MVIEARERKRAKAEFLVDPRKVRKNRGGIVGRYQSVEPDRRLAVSPRDYDRKLDLIRLYELLCLQVKPEKIAEIMGKSPSWVSKNIRRISEDFAQLFQSPAAETIIAQNVQQYDNMIAQAMKILTTTKDGDGRKLAAVQTCADLIKKKAEYQVTVGLVKQAPTDVRFAGVLGVTSNQRSSVAEIRDELSMDDLTRTMIEVADSLKNKQPVIEAEFVSVEPEP